MKNFNMIDIEMLESCFLVVPQIQDSSYPDLQSLKAYNNTFNCHKKIPATDELDKIHQEQTKTVLNKSKTNKLNSNIKDIIEKSISLSDTYTGSYLIDENFNELMNNEFYKNKDQKYLEDLN